jgi:hypothetical protein
MLKYDLRYFKKVHFYTWICIRIKQLKLMRILIRNPATATR